MSNQNTIPVVTSEERLKLVVDIWKHSVGVQMHFNDLGMKTRGLYFTILAAGIGLIGVVQGRHIEIIYPRVSVHLTLFVLVAMIPLSMLFYFLDKYWYHRLLLGAVKQCAVIENRYRDILPEIQLGTAISKESPVKFSGWFWHLWFCFIRDHRFVDRSQSNLHSDAKIEVLYKSVMFFTGILIAFYIFFGAIEINHCSIAAKALHGECPSPSTDKVDHLVPI